MSSAARLNANRKNALQSTGPKTEQGKVTARANAMQHGIFSRELFLDETEEAVFQDLRSDLQCALKPVGPVECAIVDRIAVTLLRQRRLTAAEGAVVRFQHRPDKIAKAVSYELDTPTPRSLSASDLELMDPDVVAWCSNVLAEIDQLEMMTLEQIRAGGPLILEEIERNASADKQSIEVFLGEFNGGLTAFITELARWCREQLREAERRPHLQELAGLVKARAQVPATRQLELLTRYQAMLDNQFYKAIKAFHEVQEQRIRSIDATCDTPD